MLEPITVHASQTPRFLACPPSVVFPEGPRPAGHSEPAQLGSAVHSALARMVRGEWSDLETVAEQWDVETDKLQPLYFMARQVWLNMSERLHVMDVEVRLAEELAGGQILLQGTADIIAAAHKEPGEPLVLWDWKSGRVQRNYWPQLYAYAYLGIKAYPEASAVRVAICWIRDRKVEIRELKLEDITEWRDRMRRAAESVANDVFFPSPENCEYCPRRHVCPGRRQLIRNAITCWPDVEAPPGLPAQRLGNLYTQSKMLARALSAYNDALRTALEDGPITTEDGKVLSLEEQEREKINPAEAWPTIVDEIGTEGAVEAVSLSKTRLRKAVSARTPRGHKGERYNALLNALDERGAVSRKTYQRITVTDQEEAEKDE